MKGSRLKLSLAAAAAAALFVIAGCGDDDSDSTQPATPTGPAGISAGELQAQFDELRQCVEDEGVDLPDADESPADPTDPDPELIEALQACEEFIPRGPGALEDEGGAAGGGSSGADGDG